VATKREAVATTAGAPTAAPAAESPTPTLSSASYEEIVSKWCFVCVPLADFLLQEPQPRIQSFQALAT
jgi:hypothetical protein